MGAIRLHGIGLGDAPLPTVPGGLAVASRGALRAPANASRCLAGICPLGTQKNLPHRPPPPPKNKLRHGVTALSVAAPSLTARARGHGRHCRWEAAVAACCKESPGQGQGAPVITELLPVLLGARV